MVEIVPAIIASDNVELNKKIASVSKNCKRVQIDIMDGKFVKQKTVLPSEIVLKNKVQIELHLMVVLPENMLDDCFSLKPKKIIFHASSTSKHFELIEKIKKKGIKVGVALNPEDRVSKFKTVILKCDFVQIMTVHPGKYGAKFLPMQLRKIFLVKKIKKMPVEIDGGANFSTLKAIVDAHADIIGIGSAIFKARNPSGELKNFNRLARKMG